MIRDQHWRPPHAHSEPLHSYPSWAAPLGRRVDRGPAGRMASRRQGGIAMRKTMLLALLLACFEVHAEDWVSPGEIANSNAFGGTI